MELDLTAVKTVFQRFSGETMTRRGTGSGSLVRGAVRSVCQADPGTASDKSDRGGVCFLGKRLGGAGCSGGFYLSCCYRLELD